MNIQNKVGFYISRIQKIGRKLLNEKLQAKGLSFSHGQGRLLFILWEQDGLTLTEIAKKAALSKSTASHLLKKLKSQGLVSMEHPPNNDREKIVRYINSDQDIERIYQQISTEMDALFFKNFNQAEIQQTEAYLARIFSNLSHSDEISEETHVTS